MDPEAVLAGIADAVNAAEVSGNTLRVTATPAMPLAPEVPHFYPFNWQGNFDRAFGGLVDMTMTWHLLLSRADDDGAAQEASALSGNGSNTVYRAVHSRRKQGTGGKYYGDVADDIAVRTVQGPRLFDLGTDVHFWGVEFTIFAMG